MGTNFYTHKYESPKRAHIGKRSAAGLYCWDCGVTLCRGRVHYDNERYDVCPKCGKAPVKEADGGMAFRELGFNKSTPRKKEGVASCSSFSWAVQPDEWRGLCRFVYDEYGRRLTKKEFLQVLEECPLQFFDCIGVDFS